MILTPTHWRPWGHSWGYSWPWATNRTCWPCSACWPWPAVHSPRRHSWPTHWPTWRPTHRTTRHPPRHWPWATIRHYLLNVLRTQRCCNILDHRHCHFKRSQYRRVRACSWPAWAGGATRWWPWRPRWPYIWWHHYHD